MTAANAPWSLPVKHDYRYAASAGSLSFVGGAGDFDQVGGNP